MTVPSRTYRGSAKEKDTMSEIVTEKISIKYLNFTKVNLVFSAMARQKLSIGKVMAS